MKAALQVNRSSERRKVPLLDDNARAHTAKVTRQKLEDLEWEVLLHPAYWPDLRPSHYHRFHSLRNDLVTKCFDDEADFGVFVLSLSNKFLED